MSYQTGLSQTTRKIGLATICLLGFAQMVIAQQPTGSTVRRQSGGWQPTIQSTTPHVQTAYFQAQGNLSDGLPVLPVMPTAGQGMSSGTAGLPAFPGSGGLPTAISPPVNPPQEIAPPQLPMANRRGQNIHPPSGLPGPSQGYNNAQSYDNQTPYNNHPGYGNQAPNAQQPNTSQANRQVPARLASSDLRAIPADGTQSRDAATSTGGAGLREQGPPANGHANNGRLTAEGFTSGLPFVTPAPRGRYATSPYQPAIFQSADYRPLSVPVQFVSNVSSAPQAYVAPQPGSTANLTATQAVAPPSTGATPPYLTAQQATLPQFRYPQTGIYPTAYQCTPPGPTFPSTGAVPGAFIPPTLPPNLTPNLYTPNNSGYTPLFSLGQENYNVQLGRGIIGQPTVYVAGQPIRNFMRYLSP
ncbi:MAG: hypothetical protein IT422_09420 [Pirellulaceae bacterium]|nr:hypothetical protein [Pirellulaceae bacterium]